MSNQKITWEPPESKKEIEHSNLIESFVDKYILEQKNIFPKPNEFLMKMDIKDGKLLAGKQILDNLPSFDEIILKAEGNFSLKPKKDLEDYFVKYDIDIFGKSKSEWAADKEIRVGKIRHQIVHNSKGSNRVFYFSPSKSSYDILFKDKNATRTVQLIYNPEFLYNDNLPLENFFVYDKMVFVVETGHMLLVKDK